LNPDPVNACTREESKMKGYRKKLLVGAITCVIGIVGACVTINIYFPAEKVESVAGEIVQDIRGKEEEVEKKPVNDKQSSVSERIFLVLSPAVVWAQEVTSVSNPTIRGLKEKMKTRYGQMKAYYEKGVLKEGDDGYVSVATSEGLGLKEKRDVKGLVDAENNDRTQLYKEVGKALNIDPGQTDRIAGIFAKEWQKSVR
jgi:hypothetical protein